MTFPKLVHRSDTVYFNVDSFEQFASGHHHAGGAMVTKVVGEYRIDLRPVTDIGDEYRGLYHAGNAAAGSLENDVNVLKALKHLFFDGAFEHVSIAVHG